MSKRKRGNTPARIKAQAQNAVTPTQSTQNQLPTGYTPRMTTLQMLDPSQMAVKADVFSRSALDFINQGASGVGTQYTETQLLSAAMTSVYMNASLRRISNLISRVKIVAEVKDKDGRWIRTPDNVRINQLFARDGSEILSRMWLNYAVYGNTLVYKIKTRRAILAESEGNPIYDYKDGALAGLLVLDKPMYDIDEDGTYGDIKGAYVSNEWGMNQDVAPDGYLKRPEFAYVTDWNPVNPNRGKSIVSIAIHEAVANSAIAQWMSEYFTRGAMPFVLVSMEDDPNLMSDADIRKYKRQFEEHWQGLGSSLRSAFIDRKVTVEQVGINASDIGASDLNETALEGISAAFGLDRELIVTPSGGSQARHDELVQRAWNDTIIPLAEKFVRAFNTDLGLAEDMRLVLDLSGINELDADREQKSGTETSIYESGLQTYNEARTRIKMPPVPQLEDFFNYDGKPTPLEHIIQISKLPPQPLVDYATNLWDSDLATRNQVLEILGLPKREDVPDGYKSELDSKKDLVQSMWQDDLLKRSEVIALLGFKAPDDLNDGYRSELERGADYGDFITSLWSDNLLTRKQTIQALELEVDLNEDAPDGYADEIGERKSTIMDLWSNNLMTKHEVMKQLKSPIPQNMLDGFQNELEAQIERETDAQSEERDFWLSLWGDNLIRKSTLMEKLGIPIPEGMIDGFQSEIEAIMTNEGEYRDNERDFLMNLWSDQLITRKQLMTALGIPMDDDDIDGFKDEVGTIEGAIAESDAEYLTKEPKPLEDESGQPILDENGKPKMSENRIAPYSDYRSINRSIGKRTLPTSTHTNARSSKQANSVRINNRTGKNTYSNTHGNTYNNTYKNTAEDDYIDALARGEHDNGEYVENLQHAFSDEMVSYYQPETMPVADYHDTFDDPTTTADDWETALIPKNERIYSGGAWASDELDEGVSAYTDADDESPSMKLVLAEVEGISTGVDLSLADVSVEYLDETELVSEPNSLCFMASVQNDELVLSLQNKLREFYGDDELIEWVHPSEFHVTLHYVDNGWSDRLVSKLHKRLPESFPSASVTVNGVSGFVQEEFIAVYARVTNHTLDNIRDAISAKFGEFGLSASNNSYTQNDRWTPHITLAYIPSGYFVPRSKSEFTINVQSVIASDDNFETLFSIPVGIDHTPTPPTDNPLDVIINSETNVTETTDTILVPTIIERDQLIDALEQWIRSGHTSSVDAPQTLLDLFMEYVREYSVSNTVALRDFTKAIRSGMFDSGNVTTQAIKSLSKARQDDVQSELRAWERASIKSISKGLKFETENVPDDLATWVKTQLSMADDAQKVKAVFLQAKNKVNGEE